jgi:magnesium transporter
MTIQPDNKQEQLNIESITWGNLSWINIVKPTKREISYLAQNYQFNQMDLDDCLSKTQRPKVDTYKDYVFWVLHFPIYNRERRIANHTQVSVFIGEKYIVTLHEGEVKPLVRLFQECKDQEDRRRENFTNGSAYLLYRILDGAVDAYFPILDKILSLLDNTEDRVFDENVEVAQEISTLRRDVITQRRISFPMRSVIAEMDSKLKRFASIDMSVYFDDLLDHANKICETLDECKEIIEVFKDADYILSTERLNRIMRTLTIISTIMLPLIVLSGLWSMNVPLPFGADPGGHHYFFYIILAMLLLVVSGMLYLFRRKHWI